MTTDTTDDLNDPEVRKLAALRAYLAGDLATFEALTDPEFELGDEPPEPRQ